MCPGDICRPSRAHGRQATSVASCGRAQTMDRRARHLLMAASHDLYALAGNVCMYVSLELENCAETNEIIPG